MVFPMCCLCERCAWRQQDFILDPNIASLHHRPSLPRIRDMMKPYETIMIIFGRMVTIVIWHILISQGWNQHWCHTCGSIFFLSVACMKGVLEDNRILFQTLIQHHFITDHNYQGYVIWWNHMKPLWLFLGRWLQSLVVWHMLISQGWNQPWCHTCGSIRHFFIGSIDPAVAWAVAADNQHPRVQSEVTNFQKHTTSACWWSLQDPYGRSRMVGAQ